MGGVNNEQTEPDYDADSVCFQQLLGLFTPLARKETFL